MDSEVDAAIRNVKQELLPRMLNFVPAKYEYKMQVSECIQFAEATDSYSIFYAGKTQTDTKPAIYSRKKLATIKNWADRFPVGNGFPDQSHRGFAISVLYALRSVPVFRQHCVVHKKACQKVGCTMCKIAGFFVETERSTPAQFPLDLNVFDRSYRIGNTGDSAEFFMSLLNVLQYEEVGNGRFVGSIGEYTSAIGQMFHIESSKRIICDHCGRVRAAKDSCWTYIATQSLDRALDPGYKWAITDEPCDACENPGIYINEKFEELPIVFTVQVNCWNDQGQFRKRKFEFERFMNMTINGVHYKLCAFTKFDGSNSEAGGRYSCVFLSSSGTWNVHNDGEISTISASSLSGLPQLLFYTRDEENEETEQIELKRIAPDDDNDDSEPDDTVDRERLNRIAMDTLTRSIQKQLEKNAPTEKKSRAEEEPVIVVDARAGKRQRHEKTRHKTITVANPMEMLMKGTKAHDTAKWNGVQVSKEHEELTKPWREEGLDDWDRELDKGHVRKLKKPRPPPVENPFDNIPDRRKPGDFNRGDRRGGFRGGRRDDRKRW